MEVLARESVGRAEVVARELLGRAVPRAGAGSPRNPRAAARTCSRSASTAGSLRAADAGRASSGSARLRVSSDAASDVNEAFDFDFDPERAIDD